MAFGLWRSSADGRDLWSGSLALALRDAGWDHDSVARSLRSPLWCLTTIVGTLASAAPDSELLAGVLGRTLGPGVRVEVKEKHPFDGPLVLRVDGKDRTLGATVANQVFVQKSA